MIVMGSELGLLLALESCGLKGVLSVLFDDDLGNWRETISGHAKSTGGTPKYPRRAHHSRLHSMMIFDVEPLP
jgi:hypothetical protein